MDRIEAKFIITPEPGHSPKSVENECYRAIGVALTRLGGGCTFTYGEGFWAGPGAEIGYFDGTIEVGRCAIVSFLMEPAHEPWLLPRAEDAIVRSIRKFGLSLSKIPVVVSEVERRRLTVQPRDVEAAE